DACVPADRFLGLQVWVTDEGAGVEAEEFEVRRILDAGSRAGAQARAAEAIACLQTIRVRVFEAVVVVVPNRRAGVEIAEREIVGGDVARRLKLTLVVDRRRRADGEVLVGFALPVDGAG